MCLPYFCQNYRKSCFAYWLIDCSYSVSIQGATNYAPALPVQGLSAGWGAAGTVQLSSCCFISACTASGSASQWKVGSGSALHKSDSNKTNRMKTDRLKRTAWKRTAFKHRYRNIGLYWVYCQHNLKIKSRSCNCMPRSRIILIVRILKEQICKIKLNSTEQNEYIFASPSILFRPRPPGSRRPQRTRVRAGQPTALRPHNPAAGVRCCCCCRRWDVGLWPTCPRRRLQQSVSSARDRIQFLNGQWLISLFLIVIM